MVNHCTYEGLFPGKDQNSDPGYNKFLSGKGAAGARFFWTVRLLLLVALVGLPQSMAIASAAENFRFGQIVRGVVRPYHQQNGMRQDLSGAASHDGLIVTVDDGGNPPKYHFAQAMHGLPDDRPLPLPFSADQKDLEGATWSHGYYVTTTSMALLNKPAFPGLTRFTVDPVLGRLTERARTPFRSRLLAGLRRHFGEHWFQRVDGRRPRSGGLNVEAVTRLPNDSGPETVLLGLRYPLFGEQFGDPRSNAKLSLADGEAIVAVVADPFGQKPSIRFETLDLNGAGIRGMEWVPALGGIVIISGPVTRGRSFGLWLWQRPHRTPKPLSLPGFQQLCRPESVIQFLGNEVPHLVVFSEHSGSACANATFSFIKAEVVTLK